MFYFKVLSLVSNPHLMDKVDYASDVKMKAKSILAGCRGGSAGEQFSIGTQQLRGSFQTDDVVFFCFWEGAYSDSAGIESIRKHVAEYIQRRDGGIPADHDNVILCAGASEGIRACFKLFKTFDGPKPGVMIPIPQYPLYSATLAEYDLEQVQRNRN